MHHENALKRPETAKMVVVVVVVVVVTESRIDGLCVLASQSLRCQLGRLTQAHM